MSMKFNLDFDESSFSINKLPNKNKASEYLMTHPLPLPDFSIENTLLTPKTNSYATQQPNPLNFLSASNALSPMSSGQSGKNTQKFMPFV